MIGKQQRWTVNRPHGRWRIGRVGHVLAPGFGDCLRCKTPWLFVRGHSTYYTESRGCFPLCEQCWEELGDAEARLPYYLAMWHDWCQDVDTRERAIELEELWPLIERAVIAEDAS